MKAEEVMRDAINIKCACLRGGGRTTPMTLRESMLKKLSSNLPQK